jgi:hypothetical protein
MRLGLVLLVSASAAAGCVSSEIREGAERACQAQQVPEREMRDCIDRMEDVLRAARDYRPPTTPPNER